MYIKNWSAFVSFTTVMPNRGKLQIQFRAWLQCPFCRNVSEVETNPDVLRKTGDKKFVARSIGKIDDTHLHNFTIEAVPADEKHPIAQFIYRALTMITQQRTCKTCGIVSGVPEADKAKTHKDMLRDVTDEWIEQQLTECLLTPIQST